MNSLSLNVAVFIALGVRFPALSTCRVCPAAARLGPGAAAVAA
ncbi:hypothetical protein [Deinococcus aerophilus]|nr:hypothetical protein [Deinococcus aerophilus]